MSLRAVAVAATTLSLVLAGQPAWAKPSAHTTISAHLTASTVLVGSTATVSGTATPAAGPLDLERLVGTSWHVFAHARATRTGAFVFSVRAPKAVATWSLKVVRLSSSGTVSSPTLHLHVVNKEFVVAAASAGKVTAPATSLVTGVVVPAGAGSVQVQELRGKAWIAVATGKLSATGAFSVGVALPVGTHRLRVLRPYTSTVAQGTSAAFTVTVDAVPTVSSPVVVTAALPTARVGVAYASLLTATGGNGFYQWSGTGLPAGLTLSAAGLVAGVPLSQGSGAVTVTVTDGTGRSGVRTLTLTTGAPAGRLFASGSNAGELGIGTAANATTIVPVIGMTSVVSAAASTTWALAAKADGTVWAWGANTYGQLGTGDTTPTSVPVQVAGLTDVVDVAAGAVSSYALTSTGTVFAWGRNTVGELGDGAGPDQPRPVQVNGLSSVVAIYAAETGAYALLSDGTVRAWGDNGVGQLGDGTRTERDTPVQVTGLAGVKQLAVGGSGAYALLSDGTVAAWGGNTLGQLGLPTTTTMSTVPLPVPNVSQVTQLSSTSSTAYAVTSSGTVIAWGYNRGALLGAGTANGPSLPVTFMTGAVAVTGGFTSGYALLPDHTVVGWGDNSEGQLGDGSTTEGLTPTPMTAAAGVQSVISNSTSTSVFLIAT